MSSLAHVSSARTQTSTARARGIAMRDRLYLRDGLAVRRAYRLMELRLMLAPTN